MSRPPALRLLDATIGYAGKPVVAGIGIELALGSSLALVGTNGSGKSTLLRALAGLLAPSAGTVSVLGSAPGAAPARVAYLSQFHTNSLLLPIRVEEVVRMGRFARRGLLGRMTPADGAAVRAALAAMGVRDLSDVPLRDLSGGQQQRVFIAQALARQADLLLLDEPAAGLDTTSRALLNEAVRLERERGAAIVTATHDIGDAMRADLVLLLARRVVAFGSPNDVLTRETLLETFGLAIQPLEGGLLVMDTGHGHGHADPR